MGADGALTTAVHAGYMPIPSTGRARLAVSAVVLLAALRYLLLRTSPTLHGHARDTAAMFHHL
ncbi:hypothetical protein AZ54_05100 [Xanthomonas oryzae pv. oryzae PXO86]|nr:hypothetical protein AZ54_05100 [Xanthomonas oryzae pv. oryzae PXO86]